MFGWRIGAAVLGFAPGLIAGALTLGIYRGPTKGEVDFEKGNDAGFISEFAGNPHEVTRGFRWTTGNSLITLENLPDGDLEIELRLKAPRPPSEPAPHFFVTADGETVLQGQASAQLGTYGFTHRSSSSSLRLGVHSETIFIPAWGRVGVALHRVRFSSPGRPRALGPLLWMMLATSLVVASGLVAGLSPLASCLLGSVGALGFAYLLAQDGVRFQSYPETLAVSAAAGFAASVVLRLALSRTSWLPARERPLLITVMTSALLVKLAAVSYPLFRSSDAVFQLHRQLEVLAGNFFPTSVTQHQPPFRIPYPISLYVVAAPAVASGLDGVRVLQGLTLLCDWGVGLALAYLPARFWKDTRAGVLAAALYPLIPVNFLAFSAGNLTNVFGVAATVFFLTAALKLVSGGRARSALATFALSLAALTSHFSAFLMAVVLWPGWLAILRWLSTPRGENLHLRGGQVPGRSVYHRGNRGQSGLLLPAVGLSAVLALTYYAGYGDLLVRQGSQLAERNDSTRNAADGPVARLAFNLPFYREQVGGLFFLLALIGAARSLRRCMRSLLDAALAVWIVTSLLFLAVDLTTSVGTRYVLQASPLLALLAASALSRIMRWGSVGVWLASAALVHLGLAGLRNLDYCLLVRYH